MLDPVRDHTVGVAGGVRVGRVAGENEVRGIRTAKIQPVFFLECDWRPVSIDRSIPRAQVVGSMSP